MIIENILSEKEKLKGTASVANCIKGCHKRSNVKGQFTLLIAKICKKRRNLKGQPLLIIAKSISKKGNCKQPIYQVVKI